MTATRNLVVIADDYGVGPETSRGIRELVSQGVVTGTVLLVNSPHAAEDVGLWRRAGLPEEIGWHPNLTMDRPILPAEQVPSLVNSAGHFVSLGQLLLRLALGRLNKHEVRAELAAQYRRFLDLVGRPPCIVNGHKHIHIFPVIGPALRDLLLWQQARPYLRCNREPLSLLRQVPGARCKRLFLSVLGRWAARHQQAAGFAGCDWLAGVTDPAWVADPEFFARWLAHVPGETVELMVHPGYLDATLVGRDCQAGDGLAERRVAELRLLQAPAFRQACQQHGFRLIGVSVLLARCQQRGTYAA
jgi:predicted glycoside hydrolase/deacetylase ChbG (UPF0249 family)